VSRVEHPLIQTVLRFTSRGSRYANDMQLQPGSMLPLIPRIPLPTVTLMCCVGKPREHGRLVFHSADVRARPQIDYSFLVDAADRACAVEALQLGYQCARSGPMKDMAWFLWPGEKVLRDTAAMHEWIRKSCGSGYHPCGTVPMGADGDPAAALDGHGRVRGTTGLFVADASVMPTIPSSNTNLPTLMIGERFGEWLREGLDD
jgi:choline dehydrogenase